MTCVYQNLLEGHEQSHNLLENVHGRHVFISKTRPRPLKFIVLPFINPLLNCINFMALLLKAIISGKSDASKIAKDNLKLDELYKIDMGYVGNTTINHYISLYATKKLQIIQRKPQQHHCAIVSAIQYSPN